VSGGRQNGLRKPKKSDIRDKNGQKGLNFPRKSNIWKETGVLPQPVKPGSLSGVCGTTKVVPFRTGDYAFNGVPRKDGWPFAPEITRSTDSKISAGQGLKPGSFSGVCGTTKVAPFRAG
jgi:hypothetical protein